jgi:PPM family protein phosphatase
MTLSLRYAARSDVGLVRQGNEDSGYAGPRLLAVADGMGGHAAGEVASSVALAALAPLDDDDGDGDLLDALATAITTAQQSLGHAVDSQPELEGMGTTLTALLWAGNRIGLAHVGDSRAYLLRGGELMQLTRDHTYVQTLVDSGRITLEEAASHPRRSLLTRALGNGADTEPDLSIREIRIGDRFLLCSDGLSAVVSESTIHDALGSVLPQEAVDRLVDLALRAGGPDNITAIVADVVDVVDPSTEPPIGSLVVGAAGLEDDGHGLSLLTPAGRAAAALRPPPKAVASPSPDPSVRARRRRITRRLAALAVAVVVLVGTVFAFDAWTRTQYFVGVHDGQVTIFRGIPQDVLGMDLADIYEVQQIDVSSLAPTQQRSVADTIHASDLQRARAIVSALESAQCLDPTAVDCLEDPPTPSPGATPTGTATSPDLLPGGTPAPTVRDTSVVQP